MVEVSVVIPAYNAAKTIEPAVLSVLAQTNMVVEVIVVNDGSSDATRCILERVADRDPRVRLIDLGSNRGVSIARNRGLQAAKGRWVALLDSDDAFEPDRLSSLITMAEQRGLDGIFDNLALYDAVSGNALGGTAFPSRWFDDGPLDALTFLDRNTPGRTVARGLGFAKLVFKRTRHAEHAAVAYPEGLQLAEDLVFYFRLILSGYKIAGFDQPSYKYFVATSSLANKPDSTASLLSANDILSSDFAHHLGRGGQSDDPQAVRKAIALHRAGILYQDMRKKFEAGALADGVRAAPRVPMRFLVERAATAFGRRTGFVRAAE